jgi:hypothetical protein
MLERMIFLFVLEKIYFEDTTKTISCEWNNIDTLMIVDYEPEDGEGYEDVFIVIVVDSLQNQDTMLLQTDCIKKLKQVCTYTVVDSHSTRIIKNTVNGLTYFNTYFVNDSVYISKADWDSLLCNFIGDTITFNLDSFYYAHDIPCDKCVDCDSFHSWIAKFNQTFPWLAEDSSFYFEALANYLNRELSYNLHYIDYLEFWDSCKYMGRDTAIDFRLCDKGFIHTFTDTIDCYENLQIIANYNAQQRYRLYIDSVRAAFRHAYRMHCLPSIPDHSLPREFYDREYHYTLYYYDQANNLIKTVPPEG